MTYCRGEGCPFRIDCRCYDPKKEHKDYFIDTPYEIDEHSCLFFWKKQEE